MGMVAQPGDSTCPKCRSENTTKLVSRFARVRNEDDRIDELADRLETMAEPESPHEMRGLVRELGKAMDEDVADELEELFEADMHGDSDEEA